MLRVGLTGGIACGKSVVRRMLEKKGAFTVDADNIVHQLLGPGSEVAFRIAEDFGGEMVAPDGSIDRQKLGRIVFSDPEARERLNRLIHPRVIAETRRRLSEAERRGEKIGVVDAALTIETGTYRNYQRLIVAVCPRAMQRERLIQRGFSPQEANRRIEAQLPTEEKRSYADFVIDTSGTLAETAQQVDELWRKLLQEAAGRRD